MTKRRALEILRDYWGMQQSVTVSVVNEIDAVCLPKETMLETVSRIAGVKDVIMKVTAFNGGPIRATASYLLAVMDINKARNGYDES